MLLFYNKWPAKLKHYLGIYWYFTVWFSIPFLGSYLLMMNSFSLNWLMNSLLGMMFLILLVDWLMSLILLGIGIIVGYGLVIVVQGYDVFLVKNADHLSLFLYMFFHIVLIIAIFARNNEVFKQVVQKKLEGAVEARTSELIKALAVKTDFLNNVSHELKTPIQGVDAISNGLVEHWEELEENQRLEYAQQIAKNSSRLLSLVANLLDLSKYNAGKTTLNLAKMNLCNAVHEMIEECRMLYIKERELEIVFNPSKEVRNILITADYERIVQVLRNLFVNAIRYTPDDRFHEIYVNVKKTKFANEESNEINALNLSIKDEGIGIPPEELKEIFVQFSQSSRTKTKAGGTGLGLSICKEIIETHQGVIWAENNKEEKGSIFNFILPIRQVKKPKTEIIVPAPVILVTREIKPNILSNRR